ncbi:MAG: hypothetical protein V2B18_06920 [Pseudomonadota bacterium]
MTSKILESDVEQAALEWLESLGYPILHGPEIGPGVGSHNRRFEKGEIFQHR